MKRAERAVYPQDMCRLVPGYDGKYAIDRDGNVWNLYGRWGKLKEPRLMHPRRALKNKHKWSWPYAVHLRDFAGNSKQPSVLSLMVDTWFGGTPQGKRAYHKDGNISNNALYNIGFITPQELGRINATKRREHRAVAMIDETGEVIEWYESAYEAGRKNNMCYNAVINRLHNRVKKPFDLIGYSFTWEPEKWKPDNRQGR